ncbi:Sulfide:quinone oxidoreductase, mitochondrial [Lamellibrachia satsuma]|nr:Sulfide:quinone oxidoreductase, mitochondrial [Lamellibrachia satsuma]
METSFHLVKGLIEALEHDPAVCSNYHKKYVQKTYPAMKAFKEGNAIFTLPNTPIKCAGASQKIMYLTEDYFRRVEKRHKATIMFNTSLEVVFGVPKYAQALYNQITERDIKLNLKRNLVEVKYETKEAVFEVLGTDGATQTYEYEMLHVAPPCSAPSVLWDSEVSDKTGYVDVDKETCQHVRYPNVFSLGDCSNLPTSKTVAAICSQQYVLVKNLTQVMAGHSPTHKYDGYTACPLITKKGLCILAEFGYDGKLMETFPCNQAVPRRIAYLLKVYAMPLLYWYMLLKGVWNGPCKLRKMFHLSLRD